LPPRPNIEHLKNEAKARLRTLRSTRPETQLAKAQLDVARAYGFASWRALKAAVEAGGNSCIAVDDPLIGWYRIDPTLVTNAVIAVTRGGGRLWIQQTGRPKTPLVPDDGGRFSTKGVELRYRFETTSQGPAGALLIEAPAATISADRTDAADAEAAQAAYARDLAEQARPRLRATLPPEAQDRYVGAYAAPSGLVIEVRRRGASLFAEAAGQAELEILAEAEGRYFFAHLPAQLEFHGRSERAEAVTLHQNGHGTRFRRVSAAEARLIAAAIERKRAEQERPRAIVAVHPEVLERYAGLYQLSASMELTVTFEEGRLFGFVSGQRRFEMFPESEIEFFATVAAVQFSFLAGEDGEIDRVIVHQNGRDLLMMRAAQDGDRK
jgi:hypothetical protein